MRGIMVTVTMEVKVIRRPSYARNQVPLVFSVMILNAYQTGDV